MTADNARLVAALRSAVKETERLREENRRLSERDREPIAIIGMACRYPGGVASPEDLWDVVIGERDVIGEFPTDRGWDLERLFDPTPGRSGTSYLQRGGFLDGATEFDAEFFHVSPREALAMDPQQRHALEVAWQALENARIVPGDLRGEQVGVFVGAMPGEYGPRMHEGDENVQGMLITGQMSSVVSGRIAYTLGLEGPAITLDTACSSSSTAILTAVDALRSEGCSVALAGGVTVMSYPGPFTEFSKQQGLAADGRCKAFAAAADGAGWAEGAGVLVLERLSQARQRGRRILAVIRGGAVNQDGASNGLSAPSNPAQQRVIRRALAAAGVSAADVDAVEAHGTGTTLGDSIEAQALLATYGRGRDPQTPLRVGSLKSNIGHPQAAAGVGGVIKITMALRHGVLPRTLHVDAPTPHVDWASGAVEVLTEALPWRRGQRPRRAGVSAFGISGTNAHLILEEAPEADEEAGGARRGTAAEAPWILSARSPEALRAHAARVRDHLAASPEASPADVGYSLATTRTAFGVRAAVSAADPSGREEALGALAEGAEHPGLLRGSPVGEGCVFVFPGQGSQWAGMAGELLEHVPVFAARLDACEKALAPHVDFSLRSVLRQDDDAPDLERVDVVQPALWAVMVSLAEVWRSFGVVPEAVVGHSQGEIAAACVAGALSLEDGALVVARRSRALRALAGSGAMASVALPADRVAVATAAWGERLHIAVRNGPSATVIAGDPEAVAEAAEECSRQGARTRIIDVDYASHSPHIDALREAVTADLAGITPLRPEIPFYSTLSGGLLDDTPLDAEYWFRNLRHPVEFASAVAALAEDGRRLFIECSPHPVLTAAVRDCLEERGTAGAAVASLHRDDAGPARLHAAAAEAFVHGARIDWHALYADTGARAVDLPSTPFQPQRYWLHDDPSADPGELGVSPAEHPLLGAAVDLADGTTVLTARLSLRSHPWLADHRVHGTALLPGTAFLDMAVSAGDLVDCPRVEELLLEAPLVLPEQGAVRLRLTVGEADDSGLRSFWVHSRDDRAGDSPWRRHATGALSGGVGEPKPAPPAWPPPGAAPLDTEGAYAALAAAGYEYGPAFRGLRGAWRRAAEVFAEVELPPDTRPGAQDFLVHPALLDAGLHALLLDGAPRSGRPLLPFAWSGVSLHAAHASVLRLRLTRTGDTTVRVEAADATGAPVASVEALTLRELPDTGLSAAPAEAESALFHVAWRGVESTEAAVPGRWAVLGGPGARLDAGGDLHETWESFAATLDVGAAPPEAVFLPCPHSAGGTAGPDPRRGPLQVLEAMQRWLEEPRLEDTPLVVTTRNALTALPGDPPPDLGQAGVVGLVRSAQTENPGRFLLLDLDTEPGADALAAALASGEPQLALRAGRLLAPRLARAAADPPLRPPQEAGAWRLDTPRPGTLDHLELLPAPDAEAPLAPGQVRVAMRACGVNFRDVIVALGVLPTERTMGSEGAGVVVETAPDVTDLAVGERVMGRFDAAFGPLAVTERAMVVRMPEGWTFQTAASVPAVFLTAYEALTETASVRPGDTVLVHAAAGGVGMAAVQLARALGAEVFATAHPDKWPVLRGLGLDDAHIASSRTGAFEKEFRAATGGRGLDVVLNSLAGQLADASLRLLADGGRFVEIGKTDLREPEAVAREHPGVAYRPLNLAATPAARIQEMLTAVLERFSRGELHPIPVTSWDVRRAPEALRHLRESRHIGKIVLTVPAPLDPQGTVLVTGGTGTLGALLARHLVRAHGVRRLLLVSRRGPDAPGAGELRRELEELGAETTVAACDVSDQQAARALLDGIPARHPLTAVVHTAGLLKDTTLTAMTPRHIDAVMAPKADAALSLHHLTRGDDLAAFILFSSASGLVGNAGQANYAAANTVLDALAEHRRTLGLPAASLAWGLWEEASGMTGHLGDTDRERMRRAGLLPITNEQGLALFDEALASGRALAVPTPLAPEAAAVRSPLLADLRRRARPQAHNASAEDTGLAEKLSALAPAERDGRLLEVVRTHTARVLGQGDARAIQVDRPFKEMGFDSLTSVELRNRLGAATGLRLPSTLLFDHPTPTAVRDLLREHLVPGQDGEGPKDGEEPGKDALHRVLEEVPLENLRSAGLVDALLALSRGADGAAPGTAPSADIDAMDAEALVRLALEESGTTETAGD